MRELNKLDQVAYVRFASVYRDFREAADFHGVLGEIAEHAERGSDAAGAAPGTGPRAADAPGRKH